MRYDILLVIHITLLSVDILHLRNFTNYSANGQYDHNKHLAYKNCLEASVQEVS